jgi:hypothetical protein
MGEIKEGFFTYSNSIVTITDAKGEPLPGGWSREVKEGDPQMVARALLRQQRQSSSSHRKSGFSGPLPDTEVSIV